MYLTCSKWALGDFISFAKYCTVFPIARYLRIEEPPKPTGFSDNDLLFSGGMRKFLRNRLTARFNAKNLSLFQTILLGVKRGTLKAPQDYVLGAYKKHRASLQRDGREESWAALTFYEEKFGTIFRGFTPPPFRLEEPSRSASFHKKKSEGGAYAEIHEIVSGSEHLPRDDLGSMYEYRPGVVREDRRHFPIESFDEFHNLSNMKLASAALTLLGVEHTESQLLNEYLPDIQAEAMAHAVREPLKVRMITKGKAYPYYYAKSLQKSMWNHLKKYPQMALIGRSVEKFDLQGILDREKRANITFETAKWVSGDFSAATDNLKIDYTKLAFGEAMAKLPFGGLRRIKIVNSVLFEHMISYPPWTKLDPIMQKSGQLMGSPLSFPILCVCNLAAYWEALEKYLRREIKLVDLPVLVNGDDILFRCDERLYSLWKAEVAKLGFELSVGKNYVHPKYLMINSTGFVWRNGDFETIPWLNTGHLQGLSKLSERKGENLPIWDLYNTVIDGAHDKLRAHRRFLHYHKSDLQKLTNSGNFNLFIDHLYGGLGFKLDKSVQSEVHFTHFQKKFARFLKSFWLQDYSGLLEEWRKKRIVTLNSGSGLKSNIVKYKYVRVKALKKFDVLNKHQALVEAENPTSVPLTDYSSSQAGMEKNITVKIDRDMVRLFRPAGAKISEKYWRYAQFREFPIKFIRESLHCHDCDVVA
jgi:hypothetical protein